MKMIGRLTFAAILSLSAAAAGAEQEPAKLPAWSDYLDSLRPIGDRLLPITASPNDAQERQETWRILMGTLAQGYIAHVYDNPENPEFITLFSPALNLFAPNPDYKYTWAPISDKGVYRITGSRGTVRFVEVSFLKGFYTLNGTDAPTVGRLDLDTLKLDSDGAFSFILSAKRPDGYAGDWQALPIGANNILVRSASYDWVRERDARFAIERLDGPVSAPRPTAEELSRRLAELATWVEQGTKTPLDRVAALIKSGRINKDLMARNDTANGGVIGQTYIEGMFRLNDDEALILETEIPKTCRYWGILVTDDQFITIDWMNRQSSLNGFQAHLDSDGKFRAVIANKDPGVPNWLDAGGHHFGGIQGRWTRCSSDPIPTTRKVLLSEVRKYLPKDTPHVSPAQRLETLQARRRADQLRRQ